MLARSRMVMHPQGQSFRTPLLVPSFSSKGYGFRRKKGSRKVSEVSDILISASEFLTDSMLLSAYDLSHGYLPHGFEKTTEIVFVDSGGYEISDDHDLSAVNRSRSRAAKWNYDMLKRFLDSWPESAPAVFVSYDHPTDKKSLLAQVEQARALFEGRDNQMHSILLKSGPREDILDIETIIRNVSLLTEFAVIGVTEKELGNSTLSRLCNLAKLRKAMDETGIDSPIHVFGSLDPLTSILFFLVGAEIFDGLTWLRYSYHDGTAIYPFNYGTLKYGIDMRDDQVKIRAFTDNLYYLQRLKNQMVDYARNREFSIFDQHSAVLEKSYRTLCNTMGGDL